MESNKKEIMMVDPSSSKEPQIGRWLWALQETRQRTLRVLNDLQPDIIDWVIHPGVSSIGTILYHIADIEADWLYVEVLEQQLPQEVADLFPYPTRDKEGHLTLVKEKSLALHLGLLETIRKILLGVYQDMELHDFRRLRSLEHYDVTPEWVLHHLMQHEAEHRGQIGSMRDMWEMEANR